MFFGDPVHTSETVCPLPVDLRSFLCGQVLSRKPLFNCCALSARGNRLKCFSQTLFTFSLMCSFAILRILMTAITRGLRILKAWRDAQASAWLLCGKTTARDGRCAFVLFRWLAIALLRAAHARSLNSRIRPAKSYYHLNSQHSARAKAATR